MSYFMTQPTLTTFIEARNRRIDAMRRRLRNGCVSRDVVTSFSSERHGYDGANWWIVRSGASQQRHRLPRGLRLLLLLRSGASQQIHRSPRGLRLLLAVTAVFMTLCQLIR